MTTRTFLLGFLSAMILVGCQESEPNLQVRVQPPLEGESAAIFVGTWDSTVRQTLPEGTQITSSNIETYDQAGTFVDVSQTELLDGPNGRSIVSLSATASGTWKVEGSELVKVYEHTEVREFSTSLPNVTKATYQEMLREQINENSTKRFELLSSSTDELLVLEKATATQIVMIRSDRDGEQSSSPTTTSQSGQDGAMPQNSSARKLQNYPITIDLPANAVRVTAKTPLAEGTKLLCSWNSKWLPVTVLAVHEDGTVRIAWDGYSSNWHGDISRESLVIAKSVLETLQSDSQ